MQPHKFNYISLSSQEEPQEQVREQEQEQMRYQYLQDGCGGDLIPHAEGTRQALEAFQSAAKLKSNSSSINSRGGFHSDGIHRLDRSPLAASRFSSIDKGLDLDRNHPLVSESIFGAQYLKTRSSHSEWNSYIPADRFAFSVAGERVLLGRSSDRSSPGEYMIKNQPFDHGIRVRDSCLSALQRQSSGSSLSDSHFSSDIPLSTLSPPVSTSASDSGLFGAYSEAQEGGKGGRKLDGYSSRQSWAQQTEHSYNLQLALTLRLVTEAEITEEPILLPYHISETQSFLLSSGSSSLLATSLRFWVNGSLGYGDRITDGFYHVWGMNPYVWALCSNRDEDGGRLPRLDLLKTVNPRDTKMEVIVIDKRTDAHLCELENQAIEISQTTADFQMLAAQIGKLVCESMGGAAPTEHGELTSRWKASTMALKECLNCVVYPIGSVSVGLCRHRALLFKVLADNVKLPCRIARGCKYCGHDDGASCLVLCGNEREFLVDLIANPGDLSCPELFLKSLQPLAIASPLRFPQWRASEALGDDGNEWKSSINSGKGSEVGYTTHSCQASLCAERREESHNIMKNLNSSAGKQASASAKAGVILPHQAIHYTNDVISVQSGRIKKSVSEQNFVKASDRSPIANNLICPPDDNINTAQHPVLQHPASFPEIDLDEARVDPPEPSDLAVRKPKNVELLLGLDGFEIAWEELIIKERVGAGSFGTVHRADWNGSEVAVKVFIEQDFLEERLDEFMREVAILKRTRHPNVVLFMGVVMKRPNLSIVTEYLPRGSLFRLIHRPGMRDQLDERRRIRMALDVARGINYLHRLNPPIVHRDLKSPNLLVDKTWTVKVCDFGLSRLKMKTFLSSRSAAGTAEWMAPEVLRDEPSNEKSDVYSFGVILWELFTLQQPWNGLSPAQVVGAVGFQQRRLPIPNDMNPDIAALIESCCAIDPRQRPAFTNIMETLKPLQKLATADSTKTPTS